MLLSTRASPPKYLRVPPASKNLSVRYLLLHSPLPSPSLPSILPRHGKKPPFLNSRQIVRLLTWLTICVVLLCLLNLGKHHQHELGNFQFQSHTGQSYEIIGQDELPEFATPLAFKDHRGRPKWTISIPSNLKFPLSSSDYADMCSQSEEVARHVITGRKGDVGRRSYYDIDNTYIDVAEAQSNSHLPSLAGPKSQSWADILPECSRSLTYVLDSSEAGLGAIMLGLWLSYGLAQREDRAFFIDDTHFPYGQYSSIFKPPPTPKCRLPHPSQRVSCPHHARHLAVTAATHHWTFGASFNAHFSPRETFDMARRGYEALFTLTDEDNQYVKQRIDSLLSNKDAASTESKQLIGMHIRRGDRHPFEFQYQHGYLPPSRYTSAIETLSRSLSSSSSSLVNTTVLLATDDPGLHTHPDLSSPHVVRAQERVVLGSKRTLNRGSGWDGGFYKDVFWSIGLDSLFYREKAKGLGSPAPSRMKSESKNEASEASKKSHDGNDGGHNESVTSIAHPSHTHSSSLNANHKKQLVHVPPAALQLRSLMGRAYLLDLSILSNTDTVVCAVSSYGCRVLAVMMGNERAFVERRWRSVDGAPEDDKGGWSHLGGRWGWTGLDY